NRIDLPVALNGRDGAVKSEFRTDLVANHQRLIVNRPHERKLVDEPIAKVHNVVTAAPVHQHVVLIAREPRIKPIDHAIKRRARDQLTALRAKYANSEFRSRNDIEYLLAEE